VFLVTGIVCKPVTRSWILVLLHIELQTDFTGWEEDSCVTVRLETNSFCLVIEKVMHLRLYYLCPELLVEDLSRYACIYTVFSV
jgi:hypothetical protein